MCDDNNPSTSESSSMDNNRSMRYNLRSRNSFSKCGAHRNCFPLGNPFDPSTSENTSYNGSVPEFTFTYGVSSVKVMPEKIFCASAKESTASTSKNKRISETVNENCKKKRKVEKGKRQTAKFLPRPISKYHTTEGYSLKKKNVNNKRTKQKIITSNNHKDKEENVNFTVQIEINDNSEDITCNCEENNNDNIAEQEEERFVHNSQESCENNDESTAEQDEERFAQQSQESTENVQRYNILDDVRFLGYAPYAFVKDFMGEVIHVIKEL